MKLDDEPKAIIIGVVAWIGIILTGIYMTSAMSKVERLQIVIILPALGGIAYYVIAYILYFRKHPAPPL